MEKEIAMTVMDESTPELDLPGFRFHPTEEELLGFYLKNIVSGRKLHYDIIGFLNIYLHDPWDLPGRAKIGEREWYFFVPRDRKNGSGGRPNRTTAIGFWKATGSDRKILGSSEPKRMIGHKKTLVFYKGRAPHGTKTDWVMNEYRLPDTCPVQKDIVLCKIYRKATSLKVLEQRATLKQEIKNVEVVLPPSSPMNAQPQKTISFCNQNEGYMEGTMGSHHVAFKKEGADDVVKAEAEEMNKESSSSSSYSSSSCIKLPLGKDNLPELQVQRFSMDWTQDPLWTQLRSPWLDIFSPYANLLNF